MLGLVLALLAGVPPATALDSLVAGSGAPPEVVRNLVVLEVPYRTDDGSSRRGRIVCHRRVEQDLRGLFDTLFREGFPLTSVRPSLDFGHSDSLSMHHDNTVAFNWRRVKGQTRISAHAMGLALDINPRRNPFAHRKGNRPAGAVHDPGVPGTLTDTSLAVRYLRSRGWIWGGRWASGRDWQHFEKPWPAIRGASGSETRERVAREGAIRPIGRVIPETGFSGR